MGGWYTFFMILCENPSLRRSLFMLFYTAISQECSSENQPEPLLDLNMELGAVKCVHCCSSCTKHANSGAWSPKSDLNRDRRESRRFPAAIYRCSTENIVVKAGRDLLHTLGSLSELVQTIIAPRSLSAELEDLAYTKSPNYIYIKINQVLWHTPNCPRQNTGK